MHCKKNKILMMMTEDPLTFPNDSTSKQIDLQHYDVVDLHNQESSLLIW